MWCAESGNNNVAVCHSFGYGFIWLMCAGLYSVKIVPKMKAFTGVRLSFQPDSPKSLHFEVRPSVTSDWSSFRKRKHVVSSVGVLRWQNFKCNPNVFWNLKNSFFPFLHVLCSRWFFLENCFGSIWHIYLETTQLSKMPAKQKNISFSH